MASYASVVLSLYWCACTLAKDRLLRCGYLDCTWQIWIGDLNYHCANVSAVDALTMIRQGRCRQLLVDHDELLKERADNQVCWLVF